MHASRTISARKGRKNLAHEKKRGVAALSHEPQCTWSPEGAKEDSALPFGWEWKSVGEMVDEMQYGTSAKTSEDATGVPVLRMGNIKDGGLVLDSLKYLPKDHDEFPALLLQDGDLLFNRTNSAELVGKSAVYRGNPSHCSCASYLIRTRLRPNYVPEFLAYFINSTFGRAWVNSVVSQQVGQANVNGTKLKALSVPIPPLSEQRRIVAEIEKQFTRLEAGVAALRRVHINLKRYRAAVFKAACEGLLVPTEAELAKTGNRKAKFETGEELLARILTERHRIHDHTQVDAVRKKKYQAPAPPSIPADERLPEGWTWATWDQMGFSQNGRPFPSAEYKETGFKLLRPGNLHVSGKVVWTDSNTRSMPQRFADENPDLIVRDGELVMNLTAQSLKDEFLGRVCITGADEACLLNQRLARLTPIIVLPQFALYLMKAWRFRRFVDGLNSGSLIQHMFTSQLAEFTFPLPPLAEQTRIVAEVERRLSVVEELESVVSANLLRATRLRQSILKMAFSGEL